MATARLSWITLFAALTAGTTFVACSTPDSPTELDPEGPPMVREVFMVEAANCPGGSSSCQALAYGTHPTAVEQGIKRKVLAAAPITGQKIRVVIDELLVGNYLEEIACNAIVDTDQYQSVAPGTTPDDIAGCATAPDVLPTSCPADGEHSVCLCQNANGCSVAGGTTPFGQPVGILDEDDDGTSDDTQFVAGAVGIRCQGVSGAIDVPMDLQASYWQPSGNQQVPAAGGLNALGPAVVLVATHGLPTSSTCQLVFSDNVTDKVGNTVCAPKWGADGAPDILDYWPPEVPCDPGDTTDVTFGVDVLRTTGSLPTEGSVNFARVKSGQTYAEFTMNFNAAMAPSSFANATLTPDPGGALTALIGSSEKSVLIRVEGGLGIQTAYTLNVPAPTDYYGQPLGNALTIHFTSGN